MMHRNIRGCLLGAVITAGLFASGSVAADVADTDFGTDGPLPGTHVAAPVNINPEPGTTPPIVAQPVVNPGAATIPVVARPGMELPAAQPNAVNTDANSGLLVVGVLLLAFGGLLALILGRKRS
ncbi:hypothetical protein [Arthrobacter sp. SLBN-112]|uniref:hypothetical protein n=1 Tax=Arthrobacter sp. SLBN-112 TaxID=2768452 RepID=UPI0027B82119|nr:hypothetical protein [Arthrobacter sp. SLBN-112]MDQ0798961.1 hypothetical protein [Arthrobacter sp. SLBN-112]